MEKNNYDFRNECLFLCAFSLWMTGSVLGLTRWHDFSLIKEMSNYAVKLAYIIWCVQFLLKRKYSSKDVLGIVLFVFVAILAFSSVYNKTIISCMLMVYLSSEVDYRKILKCTLIIQTGLMLATTAASFGGIIDNVIWENDLGRIRYDLGYDYCAYPAHIMLFLTMIWFCIRKHTTFIDVGLFVGANYFIYYWTDSRADFYLALLSITGFVFLKKIDQGKGVFIKRILTFGVIYGAGISSVISILAHLLYNPENEILYKVNEVLSDRLLLGYEAIQKYGFTLFGQMVKWYGQGGVKANPMLTYNYVDCAFLKEAITYGVVFLAIVMIGFYYAGKKIVQKKEWNIAWAVIISFLYSVYNAHLFWVHFNVFILVLGVVFAKSAENIKLI